ncbi:packaged DNA stabilization gp4 family protein [Paraburkholderia sp. GAS82]|uniref:packaged DNA stabilization gp4 family protein n=1 Tax=Paraburkholderia sp. GAS82 TaxID=3035137 RepID=UPI003D1F2989
MTKKLELIHAAYAELGLAEYVFDLQPEELTTGLHRLDRMAAEWDALGIRIGYNLPASVRESNANDEACIPDWAEDPFITNLALRIAPTIPKQVSIDTRIAARAGYNILLIGNYEIPQMQYPRQMPIGTGNRRNVKNQTYFAPVERVTTTHDAILEPSGNPFPDIT